MGQNRLAPAAALPADTDVGAVGDARVTAQALGQGGQRRGLRGGAPVLKAARAAYLHAEWTGEHDRRLPSGALAAAAV